MNKRSVGTEVEQRVASYLRGKGMTILASNYRSRVGEIDLIGRDGATLCFIEVKYRTTTAYGRPEEAVDARKMHTIRMVAQHYLASQKLSMDTPIRFDVAAVTGDRIRYIPNAF